MVRFRSLPILLALGACSGPEIPEDLFSLQGAVAGTVRTAAQAPVVGATVTATAQYPLGSGSFPLVASGLTDTAGRFRLLFTAGNLADTLAPLVLHVVASGFAPHDTSGLLVRISRVLPPRDTTHVVITVAP
jgi:hypothetical protein